MAPPNTVQAAIEAKTTRLRQIEAEYLRAKEYMKGVEWQQLRDRTLLRIQESTATYHGKDATEAVFILGKIKQILLDTQERSDVIIEYEGIKRELDTYYAQRQ